MSSRARKQQKVGHSSKHPDNEYTSFTEAARRKGIVIDGVRAERIPGAGLGLRAIRPISKDERLLFVPEAAMFKPDIKLLKTHNLFTTASPSAQIALSALSAFTQSPSEFLQIWQASWPTSQDFSQATPLCWPPPLQNLLPPSTQAILKRQIADYQRDWNVVRTFCATKDWSEEDFRYYWMVIDSRCFHWKPPSTSTVKHRSSDHRNIARGTTTTGRGGSMVMCPYLDLINHGPTGSSVNVFQRNNGYEVLSDREYAVGEEIHATYGAHPNDRLLVNYGFVLDLPLAQNPDENVRLDQILLPALTETVKAQLQDVGYLGGYALTPATDEICFKTQVAVRAMLLTCNEWEYFMNEGEDLGDDQTTNVNAFLCPLFEKYGEEVSRVLQKIEKTREENLETESGDAASQQTALTLIGTHWRQIRDALQAYRHSHDKKR